jgi:sugar-phosphatase
VRRSEGYLIAARALGVDPVDVLAFEDTEAGVASAKAAGMRVVGITRTLGATRLAAADELVERIDLETMRGLLS